MSDEGAREYKQLPPSLSEAEERRFRQAVLVNKANQVELSDAEVLELARKALRSERADDCDLVYDAVAFSLKARGKYGEGLRRLMERVVGENWGDIRADIVEEGGGRWKGKNSPTAVLVEQMRASGNEAFVGKGIEVLSEGGEGVAKRIVGERKFDREHEERWEWILREAIKKSEKGGIKVARGVVEELVRGCHTLRRGQVEKLYEFFEEGGVWKWVKEEVIHNRVEEMGVDAKYFSRVCEDNVLEVGDSRDFMEMVNFGAMVEVERMEKGSVKYLHNEWGNVCFFRFSPEMYARMYREREKEGKWVFLVSTLEDANGALVGQDPTNSEKEEGRVIGELWRHGYMVRHMEVGSQKIFEKLCTSKHYKHGADGFIFNSHGDKGVLPLRRWRWGDDLEDCRITSAEILRGKLESFNSLLADFAPGVATMCYSGAGGSEAMGQALADGVAGAQVHAQGGSGRESKITPLFDTNNKLVAWRVMWGRSGESEGVVFNPRPEAEVAEAIQNGNESGDNESKLNLGCALITVSLCTFVTTSFVVRKLAELWPSGQENIPEISETQMSTPSPTEAATASPLPFTPMPTATPEVRATEQIGVGVTETRVLRPEAEVEAELNRMLLPATMDIRCSTRHEDQGWLMFKLMGVGLNMPEALKRGDAFYYLEPQTCIERGYWGDVEVKNIDPVYNTGHEHGENQACSNGNLCALIDTTGRLNERFGRVELGRIAAAPEVFEGRPYMVWEDDGQFHATDWQVGSDGGLRVSGGVKLGSPIVIDTPSGWRIVGVTEIAEDEGELGVTLYSGDVVGQMTSAATQVNENLIK